MEEPRDELHELMARHELMSLFEELSFSQKFKKVVYGLRQPRESGDYKYAKLQLLRLLSPLSAIIAPFIVFALITILAEMAPPPPPSVEVQIMDPEEVEDLEELEEILSEPIEPPEPIEMDFTTDISIDTEAPVSTAQEVSQEPATFDAVALIKNPTAIMKGIVGNRSAGGRKQALAAYHGSGVTEGAVIRALRWLKKYQSPNGSWPANAGGCKDPGSYTAPSMTALALLTFLAHGETPISEEFGEAVEKAIKYLCSSQEASGLFSGRDGHDYTLPIVTYALCEAYALTRVPMIRDVADKALDYILSGQHETGLWDYNCRQSDRDDISYGGWCAQALKAAKMAGIKKDGLDEAMRLAIKGLKGNAHSEGGFGYTGPGKGPLTGVGVLCMQLLGGAKEPETRKGLMWLDTAPFNWEEPWGSNPIYYWYYVTQAKFHDGGTSWLRWNKMFSEQLVLNQTVLKGAGDDGKDLGYWEPCSEREYARSYVYNTSLCALQLQVYYRYLPTFKTPKEVFEEEDFASDDEIEIEISI